MSDKQTHTTPGAGIEPAQRLAVEIASMPRLREITLELLREMPTAALPLLWQTAGDEKALTATWIQSAALLDAVDWPQGQDLPRSVGRVLRAVGHSWRALPAAWIAAMTCKSGAPLDRLGWLELRHVAQWALHGAGDADGKLTWEQCVDCALAWREHDEIRLRREPFEWEHPIGTVQSAVFEAVPVCSTAQLVAQHAHHEGVLCDIGLASRCRAGLEAWWLAEPRYKANGNAPLPVALGLERSPDSPEWTACHVFAEPACYSAAHEFAHQLRARANADLKLEAVRTLADVMSDATHRLRASAVAILNSLGSTRRKAR